MSIVVPGLGGVMGEYDLSDEVRSKRLYRAGTESQVASQHRRILGRTVSTVDVEVHAAYIRVLPTITAGMIPRRAIGRLEAVCEEAVWATISYHWGSDYYSCIMRNLPGEERTRHGAFGVLTTHTSLKSALRHARKLVGKYAAKPYPGWTYQLATNIPDLTSMYPSKWKYDFDRSERLAMEVEMREAFEDDFGGYEHESQFDEFAQVW